MVDGVSHHFGGGAAVDDCSWSLREGLLAALIGPNGAGKTTLVNLASGALRLQRGHIRFDGVEIGGLAPHRIAQKGLVRTFQIARDFQKLTVLENMLVAPRNQPGENLLNVFFRPGLGRAADRRNLSRAAELLEMFDIYALRNEYANALSGGQQRLLELARAMMSEPKVLMLDEPMAAISPVLVERIGRLLQNMRGMGMTILMVEHNLAVVDQICEWVTVMTSGRVLASGSMAELRKHPEVISAYLGRDVVERTAS